MKKLSLALILALCFLPVLCFADDTAAATMPQWFVPVANLITAIPVVGPFILGLLKYVSVVSAIMTALSSFLLAVSQSVSGIAKAAGFVSFAQKVESLHDTIWPWLAYLSVYNVQKQGASPAQDQTVPSAPAAKG